MGKQHVLLFWLFFSGCYLTRVMPISPVYFAFVITMFFSVHYVVAGTTRYISIVALACLFFTGIMAYQFLLAEPPQAANFMMTFFSPVFTYVLFRDGEFSAKPFRWYSIFYSLLFILDGIWRILHPDLSLNVERLEELGVGFGIYKINSLMYIDSNFVGFQAVFVLSAYLWSLRFYREKASKVVVLLLVISILLTLSRAAIVGMLLSFFLYFSGKSKVNIVVFGVIALIVGIEASEYLEAIATSDVSFNSKFEIVDRATSYLNSAGPVALLFGVGIGEAEKVLGIGAHNLLVGLLVESGLLGALCFLGLTFFYLYRIKIGRWLLVLPILVVGMSLSSFATPYFFTLLSIAELLTNKRRDLTYECASCFCVNPGVQRGAVC